MIHGSTNIKVILKFWII